MLYRPFSNVPADLGTSSATKGFATQPSHPAS